LGDGKVNEKAPDTVCWGRKYCVLTKQPAENELEEMQQLLHPIECRGCDWIADAAANSAVAVHAHCTGTAAVTISPAPSAITVGWEADAGARLAVAVHAHCTRTGINVVIYPAPKAKIGWDAVT